MARALRHAVVSRLARTLGHAEHTCINTCSRVEQPEMHLRSAVARFRPMRHFAGLGCSRAMLCKGQEPIRKPQSLQHGCTVLRAATILLACLHSPSHTGACSGVSKVSLSARSRASSYGCLRQSTRLREIQVLRQGARPESAHQEQNASPSKSPAPRKAPRTAGAAWPNTSFKRSANGRPPGPRYSAGLHCLQRGPGVLPLSPA